MEWGEDGAYVHMLKSADTHLIMVNVPKVYLEIICLDMTHHIPDDEVSGYDPNTVFNLFKWLIFPWTILA